MNKTSAIAAKTSATLCRLRHAVAKLEGYDTDLSVDQWKLAFGDHRIDAVLQGGLAPGSLHELAPAAASDVSAAAGFALALAARAHDGRNTLWIQTDLAAWEAGHLYGPGYELFGLPARQLLLLKVACPLEALWAMEEALKCRALASVIVELANDKAVADLTATRRLTLAARDGGGFGFLLRHKLSQLTSAAETRWRIAAAPSRPDRFGGLGRTAFALSLIKNRHGPTGQWTVTWDHHARAFPTLSLGVAQTTFDRPDRTPLARAV